MMKKQKLGQFFTNGNPFNVKQFDAWRKEALKCQIKF